MMRAFARSFHRHPDDADELVQDTLLRALSSIGTFIPGTSLKSWMFTIMRNAFNTSYARRKWEPVGLEEDVVMHPAAQEWCVRAKEL